MTFPDTTFVNYQTVIEADWLNAVNEACQERIGNILHVERFSGTGSQTVFVSTYNTVNEDYLSIYINGAYQQKNTYSYDVDTQEITFSEAPPLGTNNIEVVVIAPITVGETDSSLVQYDPPFVGSVATTVEDKLAQTVSVKDFGAVGDGVTDDTAAFNSTLSANVSFTIPEGNYKTTGVVTNNNTRSISVDPNASFSGTGVFDMLDTTQYIGQGPVLAYESIRSNVGIDLSSYEHIVGYSSSFKATSTSSPVCVAFFGDAEANASGTFAFGSNFGCFVSASGGTGIACELDSYNTASGGLAYGLAIDAIGTYPSEAAIVIQNNNSTAWFKTGISFNNANGTGTIASNGAMISANAGTAGYYLKGETTATVAEIQLPSFVVGPTAASLNSIIRVDSSATNTPTISGVGSASIISPIIKSKGNNSSTFINIDGATGLRVTGLNSNTDYLEITNGSAGATLAVNGSSTNADLALSSKGTGHIRFGSLTTTTDVPITGYIEIKDVGGTVRKLAVIG